VEMDGACGAMPPHAAMCLGDDRKRCISLAATVSFALALDSPMHVKCGGRWAHKPHLGSREMSVSRAYVTSSASDLFQAVT
jgi:hypothetical protein